MPPSPALHRTDTLIRCNLQDSITLQITARSDSGYGLRPALTKESSRACIRLVETTTWGEGRSFTWITNGSASRSSRFALRIKTFSREELREHFETMEIRRREREERIRLGLPARGIQPRSSPDPS
jgi:hypothetical protein